MVKSGRKLIMMQKTVEREKRKQRKTWVGLYTRVTLTKEQKKQKDAHKEFQRTKHKYD